MISSRRAFLRITFASGVLAALFAAFVPQGRAADSKELVVFAAASLREVFQKVADGFEKSHPGVKVRLNFAGSQDLRVQIEHGAKADVFASADNKHMQALRDQKLAAEPKLFARNEPVVVVSTANPGKLARFVDLPKAERIVVGVPEVPIGAYTETILSNSEKPYGATFRKAVVEHIRSRELNVRQVLTKVSLGEADAGIVYKTDALSAKEKVTAIEIPDTINVIADYPIAVMAAAPQPDLAKEWVGTVLGADGQQALKAAGFRPAGDSVPQAAKR
jgi:molybdate transport system substrate-binding protein